MTHKLIGLAVGLCICLGLNAQIVDITSGTGTIGSVESFWWAFSPSGNFLLPRVTTGIVEDGDGNTFPNAYVHDECGRWISPYIHANNNLRQGSIPGGDFVYTGYLNVPANVSNFAVLDIPFIAADNSVVSITVNGIAVPLPATPITHTAPGALNAVIAVTPGSTDTIRVTVNNEQYTYTGLQICGSVEFMPSADVPTDLGCCTATAGEILSWASVPDAIGYEVYIVHNDPACCEGENLPPVTESAISTTDNAAVLPVNSGCFSWRVKALGPIGNDSEYSDVMCSCGPTCAPPTSYDCFEVREALNLHWNNPSGVQSFEVEVIWNDPTCCEPDSNTQPVIVKDTHLVLGDSISIPITSASHCFSWRVRSVCQDGTYSNWGPVQCSCVMSSGAKPEKGSEDTFDGTNASEKFSVYAVPNPANDQVEFRMESLNTDETRGRLIIVDMNERLVHSSVVDPNGMLKVDTREFPEGVYVYSLEFGSKNLRGKFVVTH